jgi:hypothetical protein
MSWVICACPPASARGMQDRRPGLYLDRRVRQLSSCSVMQSLPLHLPPLLLLCCFRIFADHSISLVSFSQLQKQIIDLAATHFKHLPVRPPHEELAQVPHNLPSFLGDTPASRYASKHPLTIESAKLTRNLQTSPRCLHCAYSIQADHVPCFWAVPVQLRSPLRQG